MRGTLVLLAALLVVPLQGATAQESTPPVTPPGQQQQGPAGAPGQQHGRWKQILQELNLSSEQKAQIRQIRQSTTDKRQRRQQIMALLTPTQKQQLRQILGRGRGGGGQGVPQSPPGT